MVLTKLCLLRKLKETVIIIDGWASSRLWKKKADSVVVLVSSLFQVRKNTVQKYKELFPRFLQVKAVAFSSDYDAIEAMNFFSDTWIRVPERYLLPASTTVSMPEWSVQDLQQFVGCRLEGGFGVRPPASDGWGAVKRVNIKSPVYLLKRDSVKI